MSLSTDDVRRIAHLARLGVTDEEVERTRNQLNDFFSMIEAMRAVDTTGIEPMAHAVDVVQRLREDKVIEPNRRDLFQSLAPQVENGLYLVPKVIE
jgi:aspartyl-tRNA(Asn)/glutamyl-tRNA(Gln) amidotransferase subunit C